MIGKEATVHVAITLPLHPVPLAVLTLCTVRSISPSDMRVAVLQVLAAMSMRGNVGFSRVQILVDYS